MKEKSTDELTKVLGKTHINQFEDYRKENKDDLLHDANSFFVYFKQILANNKITQQRLFLNADIPEKYGYKLLSGEKHTKQRDVILRLCYAGGLTLQETQRALEKYEMPALYPKIERDAFLMIIFNERPGTIIEVNILLKENGFESLRTSGYQD